MEETVFAGHDLGTSGCKGVLVTADGRVCARAAARYPTRRPEPGSAEQDPKDWFTSFSWVTLELAQAVGAERWQAIGLSAMQPTQVLTDGTGAAATPGGAGAPSLGHPLEPLGPAITLGRRPGGGGGRATCPPGPSLRDSSAVGAASVAAAGQAVAAHQGEERTGVAPDRARVRLRTPKNETQGTNLESHVG